MRDIWNTSIITLTNTGHDIGAISSNWDTLYGPCGDVPISRDWEGKLNSWMNFCRLRKVIHKNSALPWHPSLPCNIHRCQYSRPNYKYLKKVINKSKVKICFIRTWLGLKLFTSPKSTTNEKKTPSWLSDEISEVYTYISLYF